jgi:hypothetical protein
LPNEIAKKIRHNTERELTATHSHAVPHGHQVTRPPQQSDRVTDEAGLADARFSIHEHQGRFALTNRRHRPTQLIKFTLTPDEP